MNAARMKRKSSSRMCGCRGYRGCLVIHATRGRPIEGVTRCSGYRQYLPRPSERGVPSRAWTTRPRCASSSSTRRARITPERAGLPAYGGNRRVPGLRREEVAMLAGMSVDYYTRLERGNLGGVSESVLESLARALQLDEAERAHLFDLARTANADPAAARARSPRCRRCARRCSASSTRWTSVPAFVRNGRLRRARAPTCSARRCTPSSTRTRRAR